MTEEEFEQFKEIAEHLVRSGTAFSIEVINDSEYLQVESLESLVMTESTSGRCIKWVYVPGRGYVCVKRE